MGRVDHPVPGGELRGQGHHRGHDRAGRRQGPARELAIWHSIRDRAWWYGYGGGIASYAVAAIDMALWDIKGKLLDTSVLNLIGGPVHEKLPVIASCHAHYEDIGRWWRRPRNGSRPVSTGVKVGFGKRGDARLGYEHDRDVEYMRRCVRASGPKAWLMIDCGWNVKWDVTTAVRRVQAFEEFDLTWIEEPLAPGTPKATRTCAARPPASSPTARRSGTSMASSASCGRHGRRRGHRPRPGGRITGFKRAAERIEYYRRQANAHAWSSAICSAASIAMSFSSPAFKLFEFKPLRNPMQHDLVPSRSSMSMAGSPADQAGSGHRGHRRGGRSISQREGPGDGA